MVESVINDENFGEYKYLLFDAIKVGRSVYRERVIDKLEEALGKNAMNPKYLFSSVKDILTDEFCNVQKHLRKLEETTIKDKVMTKLNKRKPEWAKKAEQEEAKSNRMFPDLTKLLYLSSVLLETVDAEREYSTSHGDVGIVTKAEAVNYANQQPFILQEIYQAIDAGAKNNPFVLDLIKSIKRKDAIQ